MTLADFIEETETRDCSLTVVEPGDGDGTKTLDRLERFFDDAILYQESEPKLLTQFASFLPEKNLVAVSTLDEFTGEFLLIDSNFEIVGTIPRDRIDTPELLVQFEAATFLVAAGNTPILTEISHHIEELALYCDAGTITTGMQELSRLGEPRTRSIYERLAASDVETHVFGRATGSSPELGIETHWLDNSEIANSWFVVYESESTSAALVATEIEPDTYRGFWTFESELTDRIGEYLRATYL
jgi:hypothetical protein